ncbi:hypothetical protein JKP88DRAFT_287990 [Tribonema minus]|uniref:Leucine-rich repeat domain-containing protein n=1 Tax=Tribonema minus TaxID=303371 RepID=A0A835ZEW6_9STRA|nr:hypothetical protein JKP88DRAFT_287990 [Tribonema minus]
MELAGPNAPTIPADHQEMMRRVLTIMAGRRLLPKNCWSLNRVIHDTAAPTVKARLVANSTDSAISHRLLEDNTRRLVVFLELAGDFTSIQERSLNLPPSLTLSLDMEDAIANISADVLPAGLRALELGGSQHEQLDYLPPGLRVLKLCEYEHPLPQLPDTLETLALNQCTHHVAQIPDSLRSLSLELNGCAIDADLPQALQELRLGHEFEHILTFKDFRGSVTVNGGNSEQIEFGW